MATRSGGSGSRRSDGGGSGRRRASGAQRRSTSGTRRSSASARTTGADKSVEAFREALERSVMLSRDRLQEVVDDAVRRGRMTRDDANELVSNIITRGRQYTDDLIKELERLLDQARRELERRGAPARRRAGVTTGGPITAYDQLTADQVKSRLADLSPAELRQVRAREQRGKARKGVLDAIERRLK